MRTTLSSVITRAAVENPRVVVLSGDHGYALFDEVRKARPKQFINVGVAEQAMIGIAAGMCREGYFPILYGLAAFVPLRVLEQIKIDLCLSKFPAILLGDGAGLVYSTLGSSHMCGEDIAAVRALPHMQVYSPADARELATAFSTSLVSNCPTYIRVGKSDRPAVHTDALSSDAWFVTAKSSSPLCLVGTGSMSSVAQSLAKKHGLNSLSVSRIKPLSSDLTDALCGFQRVFVIEEHSRFGGLYSALTEALCEREKHPVLKSISLQDKFAQHCGDHEYALSEHGMTQVQIEEGLRGYL
jgi:transketolase